MPAKDSASSLTTGNLRYAAAAVVVAFAATAVLLLAMTRLQRRQPASQQPSYRLHQVSLSQLPPPPPEDVKPPPPEPVRAPAPAPPPLLVPEPPRPPARPPARLPLESVRLRLDLQPLAGLEALAPPPALTTAPPPPTPAASPPPAAVGSVLTPATVDAPPRPLARAKPVYPAAARRLGLQGWVQLEFVVNAGGLVEDIRILASSSERFHAAAVAAVGKWSFTPGMKDRAAVPVKCRTKLWFRLE